MFKKLRDNLTFVFTFLLMITSQHAFALNTNVNLDVSGSGPLAKVGKLMQEVVDFLGGPGVLFICFIGIAAAIGLWIVAPKSGSTIIGYVARTVSGALILMNLALIFTWLQGF